MLTLTLDDRRWPDRPTRRSSRGAGSGSYAMFIGDHRIGSFVADLLRGMLAEDPEHRPPPSLSLDPRPPAPVGSPGDRRPRSRPTQVGDQVCWHPRTLAHAIATQPAVGLQAIMTGAVRQVDRRGLAMVRWRSGFDEHLHPREPSRRRRVRGTRADIDADSRRSRSVGPMCWNGLSLSSTRPHHPGRHCRPCCTG